MSEKEKERGEALAPKEKKRKEKRVIMDKTSMYYFLAKVHQEQKSKLYRVYI